MLRVSFIFRQTTGESRVAGWSENWYLDQSIAGGIFAFDAWIKARLALCTNATTVRAVRIQEIGGQSRLIKTAGVGVLNAGQDIPQMALNCRVLGTGPARTKYFQLRGLSDGMVVDGDFVAPAGFAGSMREFNRILSAAGWKFRSRVSASAQIQIVSIDATGNFMLNGALTYEVGSTIQLLRARNIAGQNVSGTYLVEAKTDDRRGKFFAWTKGVVSLSGKARTGGETFPTVQAGSLEFYDVTTRKVGRPFGLYRGRRSSAR